MYTSVAGSSPALLAEKINIALSSKYWIIGIFIANSLSIAMSNTWESLTKEIRELIVMVMFTTITLLVYVASEELV